MKMRFENENVLPRESQVHTAPSPSVCIDVYSEIKITSYQTLSFAGSNQLSTFYLGHSVFKM